MVNDGVRQVGQLYRYRRFVWPECVNPRVSLEDACHSRQSGYVSAYKARGGPWYHWLSTGTESVFRPVLARRTRLYAGNRLMALGAVRHSRAHRPKRLDSLDTPFADAPARACTRRECVKCLDEPTSRHLFSERA